MRTQTANAILLACLGVLASCHSQQQTAPEKAAEVEGGSASAEPSPLSPDASSAHPAVDGSTEIHVDAGVLHCAATSAILSTLDGHRQALLSDVTGDANADTITLLRQGDNDFALELAGIGTKIVDVTHYVSVGAGDVNQDGQGDLIVGSLWQSEVAVFFGPLTNTRSWSAADIRATGPRGGVAAFMGAAVVVVDVNGDQVVDLVVSSPSEREEACHSTGKPRVYFGPFAHGITLADQDVDLFLDGPGRGSCLGEKATCLQGGFSLTADPQTICYATPLSGSAPSPCPADGGSLGR